MRRRAKKGLPENSDDFFAHIRTGRSQSRLSQLTVGKKIGAIVVLLGLCSTILGGVALFGLSQVSSKVVYLSQNTVPAEESIGLISAKLYRFRGDAWKHLASQTKAQKKGVESEMNGLRTEFGTNMDLYETTMNSTEDRTNFAKLQELSDAYFRTWERVLPVSQQSKTTEAYEMDVAEADPIFKSMKNSLLTMQKWNRDSGTQSSAIAMSSANSARVWICVVFGISLLLGGSVSFVVISGLNRTLRGAVQDLLTGSEQIVSAAGHVSGSSQLLARGTSEQAASLEETSASSEEINSMARSNTTNSNEAASLVSATQAKFAEANRSLDQMVVAMDEINTQSDKISKISKVIDEIAFQTNILALNAAVEAARAGEAGLGFSVVADEVRSLAHRCAEAARNTATLIEESVSKSNDGKLRVDEVGKLMKVLTEEATKVKLLVAEVGQGSHEQAQGIEQISGAIASMQGVTQSAAGIAEESAAAAEELNAQSEALNGVVAQLTALVGR